MSYPPRRRMCLRRLLRRLLLLVWLLPLLYPNKDSSCLIHGFASSNHKQEVMVVDRLAKALGMIYKEGGTLAVLKQSQGMEHYEASWLVKAALQASSSSSQNNNKGVASGILNAFLGSCCCQTNRNNNNAQMAIDLMKAYDDYQTQLQPDLVALSLAFLATSQQPQYASHAKEFLLRAEQMYNHNSNMTITSTTVVAGSGSGSGAATATATATVDWTKLKEQHGIELLQDHDEFVVVSKPSGMVCYHGANKTKKNKKNINHKNTQSLEDCLLQNGIPLSTLNQEGRGMVHRIDRGTSGCIVLAKTNRMHAILMALFFLRNVEKSYQALVVVEVAGNNNPQLLLPNKGSIDTAIGGRPATSNYTVEERFVFQNASKFSLARIKVKTEQGRRHQVRFIACGSSNMCVQYIPHSTVLNLTLSSLSFTHKIKKVRIHCSQGLGAPILLDPMYGGLAIMSSWTHLSSSSSSSSITSSSHLKSLRSANRFCLHANRLVIPDQGIHVVAPLPDWWQSLERELRV